MAPLDLVLRAAPLQAATFAWDGGADSPAFDADRDYHFGRPTPIDTLLAFVPKPDSSPAALTGVGLPSRPVFTRRRWRQAKKTASIALLPVGGPRCDSGA